MKAMAGGLLTIVLVAGCGSSGSHNASSTKNKGTTTTAAPTQDFCALLKADKAEFSGSSSNDFNVAELEKVQRAFGDLNAAAPAELKDDLHTVAKEVDLLITAIKNAGPDKKKQLSAVMAIAFTSITPEYSAAEKRIDADAKTTCGVDLKNSSDSSDSSGGDLNSTAVELALHKDPTLGKFNLSTGYSSIMGDVTFTIDGGANLDAASALRACNDVGATVYKQRPNATIEVRANGNVIARSSHAGGCVQV
ncbi:MAG TPA: hypothetical protein VFR41_00750 [Acidimicrobiia bacterium]|nr:hypothetical protein [Acidimicrobiia bacterium]